MASSTTLCITHNFARIGFCPGTALLASLVIYLVWLVVYSTYAAILWDSLGDNPVDSFYNTRTDSDCDSFFRSDGEFDKFLTLWKV